MAWLCQFEEVTQVNSKVTAQQTLYFESEPQEAKLKKITQKQF